MIRHCGVVKSTGSRVYVIFRTLLDDDKTCLVVYQDSLPEIISYSVNNFVKGRGQKFLELYEGMNTEPLEGTTMLTALYNMELLKPRRTCDIEIHLGGNQKIALDQLNEQIGTQLEVDGSVVSKINPLVANGNLDDDADSIINSLLKKAQSMREESDSLFERAYTLDPTLRPSSVVTSADDKIVVELPVDITQAKAIEIVKKTLKEHSSRDKNEK